MRGDPFVHKLHHLKKGTALFLAKAIKKLIIEVNHRRFSVLAFFDAEGGQKDEHAPAILGVRSSFDQVFFLHAAQKPREAGRFHAHFRP